MSDKKIVDLQKSLAEASSKVNAPEEVFGALLSSFAAHVGIVCALRDGGKITTETAFEDIEAIWEEVLSFKDDLVGQAFGSKSHGEAS